MASEKSFPPSELRLERLRREGIIPVSQEANSAGAIVGGALGLWWFGEGTVIQVQLFLQEVLSGRLAHPVSVLQQMGALLLVSFAQLLLPALGGVLFLTFFQTRFSFIPLRHRVLRRRRGERVVGVRIVCWGCFLGGSFLLAVPSVEAAIGADWQSEMNGVFLGEVTQSAFQLLGAVTFQTLLAVACMSGVLGAFGILLARLRFRRAYSMSREELEAEARESEMRPELRGALRETFQRE